MTRRNLIIGGSLFFLIFLAIVTNLPEERTTEEQAKQDSLQIERVKSATAKAESLASYPKEIRKNKTPAIQSRNRSESTTERYAGLIEQYGRNRAGEMIQDEIKESFAAKDFKRVELLTNASATAMQGDYEQSKIRQERRESEIQEKVDAQFSPWSGEHRLLVDTVKKTLNDPGSFEHLETTTMRGTGWPDNFIVKMDYTAKNAYGGRVRASVTVLVSSEGGHILQVLNEG